MKILLLGSGGREHALAWKLSQSTHCSQLFIAPGNAGTAGCGTNVDILPTQFEELKKFCVEQAVEMVVVGPEEPLVKGIYDFFAEDENLRNIAVIGPSKEGARLEGSKAFAKSFMLRHGIPTAAYKEFDLDNYEQGVAYLQAHPTPIVLKADGLAAGKGVIICQNPVEAMAEFELMIQQSKFGDASKKVVVEEFLTGIEVSLFVLTDGLHYVMLPEAKDYKRIGVGDKGLNTGGMGAVSPVPFVDKPFMKKIITRIVEPTIRGLAEENINYKGFIFLGVIKVKDEPYLIEYNCRLGDPETEAVIPRLRNDLGALLIAVSQQRLSDVKLEIDPRDTVTIVAVSKGYPGEYEKGFEIEGLDMIREDDAIVFHAGTRLEDGKTLTNGGRVLAITSFGKTISQAVEKSKAILEIVQSEGMYYRGDIGYEFY